MGILIDADVLIDYERRGIDFSQAVKGREQEEVFLSVITASELLHGVWRALDPAIRARRMAIVEGLLARFPVLPVDLPIAREHARLSADLVSTGTMIGPHDCWLAATCIAYGHTLVTNNKREFGRVPGLKVEDWFSKSDRP